MRKLTQRKKQAKKGKASLLFDHLEPMELAEHLTFLEFKSIRRISVRLQVALLQYSCTMSLFFVTQGAQGSVSPLVGPHFTLVQSEIFLQYYRDNLYIHGSQRMHPMDLGDPLTMTFPLDGIWKLVQTFVFTKQL